MDRHCWICNISRKDFEVKIEYKTVWTKEGKPKRCDNCFMARPLTGKAGQLVCKECKEDMYDYDKEQHTMTLENQK